MVRGRAGGGGAPFNLGEMTVTRCTVRTDSGQVGHAYVAGRDARQAELAAVFDALLQDPLAGRCVAGERDRAAGRGAADTPRHHRGEGGGDQGAVLRHAEHARMSAEIAPARLRRSGRRCAGVLPRRAGRHGAARTYPRGWRGSDTARAAGTGDGRGAADLGGSRHAGVARSGGRGVTRAGSASIAARRSCRRSPRAASPSRWRLPDLATLAGRFARGAGKRGDVDPASERARPRPNAIGWPGRACASRRCCAVDGLPADFASAWQANHALFPRGVDIVLCAGTSLAALPRSVALQET